MLFEDVGMDVEVLVKDSQSHIMISILVRAPEFGDQLVVMVGQRLCRRELLGKMFWKMLGSRHGKILLSESKVC